MRTGPLFIALLLTARALASAADQPPTPAPAASSDANGSIPERLRGMAPVDAYFGPFGMSPLSIRTMIGFLGRQYHYRTISDHDLLRKALITEDALRKWRTAYPADPWLAPTFFHLEQLYQAVQTEEARKHATDILKDTVRYFPSTKEGHLSRARLAAGFPPLVPEAPLVSTPPPTANPAVSSPTPEASAAPGGSPASSAAPAPSASPAVNASPATAASPSPTGSPSPRRSAAASG